MTERAHHASHDVIHVTEWHNFDFASLEVGQEFAVSSLDPSNKIAVLTRVRRTEEASPKPIPAPGRPKKTVSV